MGKTWVCLCDEEKRPMGRVKERQGLKAGAKLRRNQKDKEWEWQSHSELKKHVQETLSGQ